MFRVTSTQRGNSIISSETLLITEFTCEATEVISQGCVYRGVGVKASDFILWEHEYPQRMVFSSHVME